MATRRGTARDDRQGGSAAGDRLFGLGGQDLLLGYGGNDRLDGGVGADRMLGGAGNDIYVVDNRRDRVIEKVGGGLDTVRATVNFVLPAHVENLVLLGQGRLNGTGNAADNRLTGNGAANQLSAGAGADVLNGGGGADVLRGGPGSDTYIVRSAAVRIIERAGAGTDAVLTAVSYTLPANVEKLSVTGNLFVRALGNGRDNVMVGSAVANVLDGGAGNDFLDGGGGADTLIGGPGNDTFVVDTVGDSVVELPNRGVDVVRTAVDGYTLAANVERLVLLGNAGLSATGNALANEIIGTPGNDVLFGGDGDDRLVGGAGADRLVGGPGDDVYLVDAAGDVIDENAPLTLFALSFQDAADPATFVNPGSTAAVAAIAAISTWQAVGSASLLPAPEQLQGFGLGTARGKAIGAIGFDVAATLNGYAFSFAIAEGERLDLTGFSFNEQSSNGGRGQGPTAWSLRIDDVLVASGEATLGNPGGHQAGPLDLAGLSGTVQFLLTASGAFSDQATWRVDDFTLSGTVGGGGEDSVEASVDYTLPEGVEHLRLTGDARAGTGNALANVITGNALDNLLDGGGGADQVRGGAGNDVLVYDPADVLLDGGDGFDVLQVDGAGVTLDLGVIDDARLVRFEAIDLTGSGANSLLLAASDLLALSPTDNVLRVFGDGADSISSAVQGWEAVGAPSVLDGRNLQTYLTTVDGTPLQLLVELGMGVTLS